MQLNKSHTEMLEQAINDTELGKIGGPMDDFLSRVSQKFIVERIKDFPALCAETRRVNYLHEQELAKFGHKSPLMMVGGKVAGGSHGWSEDGTFKHKWIIPNQLKFFMRNIIYIDFWDDSNRKVRDSFMKAVLRGDDAFELLKKVRIYYGTHPNPVIKETINVSSDIS